jgi:hypothetical protein
MEGEEIERRIMEIGKVGEKLIGNVIIEVKKFE